MEHIFYANPEDIQQRLSLEITGQEAKHISKVLRYHTGDKLQVSDGLGTIYDCTIREITKKSVFADIDEVIPSAKPAIKKAVAFGAIKKRDRLEYAVEKAVELDAWEICIFHADHSERSKINKDRLQAIVLSAFKQSKRKWLPKVVCLDSLDEVLNHYQDYEPILAHMDIEEVRPDTDLKSDSLLLIGPEGGFSEREIKVARDQDSRFISLGIHRLRAETAVAAFLSQYLFTDH